MQIIQSIRDKGAIFVIVVIALSLIGFILMDSRQGGSTMFGGNTNDVGKVNGEEISIADFNKRVKEMEDMEEQRNGQRPSGTRTYQIRDQLWNQMVAEKIFYKEAAKLGITFTPKELTHILLSNDPSNPFLQQGLADPNTGQLDMAKAQEALSNIKKFTGARKEAVNAQIVDPLKLSTIVNKYSGLLSASAYYPTWMQEQEKTEAKNFANISYVSIPYGEISDSAVKVTDADVNAYVQKHKELFKQEAGRKVSYVTFSQLPNAADSARVMDMLNKLKPQFEADTNAKAFIARNTSVIEYSDEYLPVAKAPIKDLDSVLKYPIGTVVGPFVENGDYILAKVLGTKQMPDSVHARHILIATADRNGQQLMDDSTAHRKADSILAAIKGGADFGKLALQYPDDAGSAVKGGDLGTFGYGTMVPEFNEFTFTKPVGSLDIVKTQFGYHIINIISQKDFKPAYKVAYLAKEIIAGEATINNASLQATKASAVKTSKALQDYVAKNGLQLVQAPTIVKENDYSIGSLQDARQLVKWVFENKVGEVSEPFGIGDQFVVASIDEDIKEGTQDATTARPGAEAIIRNEKKAVIIKAKLGASPTLESAAAAYNKQVAVAGADSSLTFSSQMINGLGIEPKVIGASFNKAYQSKVSPAIEGTSGIYVIKVNSVQTKPDDSPETIKAQLAARMGTLRSQAMGNWYESLKKEATIKDYRSKVF
ncbi:MAG: SurA N-terminal domain-containing protein [Niastella sp.]|nr:SurA N-terminal domain-containing protein [Niastella sp.]